MAPPSPARLYATVIAAALVVLGLAGFFADNSWLNFLYAGSGLLGLLLAGGAPRAFALLAGIAYTVLAAVSFGDAGWLHLVLGVLGLAAFAATPKAPARSEAGAQAAGEGA